MSSTSNCVFLLEIYDCGQPSMGLNHAEMRVYENTGLWLKGFPFRGLKTRGTLKGTGLESRRKGRRNDKLHKPLCKGL